MVVFLAADEKGADDLLAAIADHLSWQSIVAESGPLNLASQQIEQASARAADAIRNVEAQMAEAYRWLLVPRLPEPTGPVIWDEIRADGRGDLVERAGAKLAQAGALYTSYPPVLLRLALDGHLASLWEGGAVTAGTLWHAYSRYLYLNRLRDATVLFDCITAGPNSAVWATEGFAVAESEDPRPPGRYLGLVAPGLAAGVRDTTLVVVPERAIAQLTAEDHSGGPEGEVAAGHGFRAPGEHAGGEELGSGSHLSSGAAQAPVVLRRFYGVASLDPGRLSRDAGRLAEEVVAHLNALDGTDTVVTIEIRAVNPSGFPETVRRVVSENAAALHVEEFTFEES